MPSQHDDSDKGQEAPNLASWILRRQLPDDSTPRGDYTRPAEEAAKQPQADSDRPTQPIPAVQPNSPPLPPDLADQLENLHGQPGPASHQEVPEPPDKRDVLLGALSDALSDEEAAKDVLGGSGPAFDPQTGEPMGRPLESAEILRHIGAKRPHPLSGFRFVMEVFLLLPAGGLLAGIAGFWFATYLRQHGVPGWLAKLVVAAVIVWIIVLMIRRIRRWWAGSRVKRTRDRLIKRPDDMLP